MALGFQFLAPPIHFMHMIEATELFQKGAALLIYNYALAETGV